MSEFLDRLLASLTDAADGLLEGILTPERVFDVVAALLVVVFGWLASKALRLAARRLLRERLTLQSAVLVERLLGYGVFSVAVLSALSQLGVELGVLLGAAGVLTVGLSFAAQTSLSNLISGLFLIAERPFNTGDTVRVGTTTGEVLQVDLLSIKLRTFDNLFVRIPNETLLKAEIVNVTHFPIRRADILFSVAHGADLTRCERALRDLADAHPRALDEPKPAFFINAMGPQGIDLQFGVWSSREGFIEFRTDFQRRTLELLQREGIAIALPHRTVTLGPEERQMLVRPLPGEPDQLPTDS